MAYSFNGRCKGTTKAGTQCKHIVVFANGFCRQHGGDSTEYERERMEGIKQKALARSRKWRRKHGFIARGPA
jgi:hypothetical protein